MTKVKKDEFITVSVHLKVNGKLKRFQTRKYYGRGRETHCYTLDDFARTIFMWEHLFDRSSTYAYDGLLQEMEKKLPKKNNETAEICFQKYWVNLDKTINDEFVEKNKGEGNKKYAIYKLEGDYLKYSVVSQLLSFERSPLPVKYAWLYWFYKYQMNESLSEIEADLKNVPEPLKKLVDSLIIKKKKNNSSN